MMCNPNSAHSDTWYSSLVARLYDPVTSGAEESFFKECRRQLLSDLSGHVLEVGAGTGANFGHYPAEAKVLAIEPSDAMVEQAEKKLLDSAVQADILLVRAGIGDKMVASRVPAEGFDAIVFTLVLCTIPDPARAIERVKSWLAPAGRLLVLEHIADDRPTVRRIEQLVNPVWKKLAEGCHLTRQTDQLLKEAGFQPAWEKYFHRGLLFYQAEMKRS